MLRTPVARRTLPLKTWNCKNEIDFYHLEGYELVFPHRFPILCISDTIRHLRCLVPNFELLDCGYCCTSVLLATSSHSSQIFNVSSHLSLILVQPSLPSGTLSGIVLPAAIPVPLVSSIIRVTAFAESPGSFPTMLCSAAWTPVTFVRSKPC